MTLIRCPECGRAADGVECLACGYAWPRAPASSSPSSLQAPTSAPAPVTMPMPVTFAGPATSPTPPRPTVVPPPSTPAPRTPPTPSPIAGAAPVAPPPPPVPTPTPTTWDGMQDSPVTSPAEAPGRSLASWVVGNVPSGSVLERFLRSPLAFVLAGGLSFVVVLGFGSLLLLGGDDPELRRIDTGKAGGVIEEMLAVPVAVRTPRQYLLLGHAYARNGATPQALAAYREAAKHGGADERALDYTIAALDHPFAKLPVEALSEWQSEDVTERLVELTEAEAWHLRHNAFKVLQERGETTGVIAERVAIVDVLHGPDCDRRREGLHRLEALGRGKPALEAIQSLRDNYKQNFCIPLTELDRAQISVEKR